MDTNIVVQSIPPTVTLLMSCYNAEHWIKEAIESVLSQTWPDFEFIIVNDGSVDSTIGIIAQYAAQDPRIVLIDKANTGLADSLNWGIRKARGRWIARVDADDLCEPHRLECQMVFILKNPDVVLLGSGFIEIDGYGRCIKVHCYPIDHAGLVRRLERHHGFFPHSSVLYKTSIVRQLGGYRSCFKCAQDRDLWLRLSEKGKLASIARPLVRIRKHQSQISFSEGGRRQLMDGHAATVSYFVRKRGGKDPVADENEIKARQFFEWIEEQLNHDAIFDRRSTWSRARAAYFAQPNRLAAIFSFWKKLLRSGHALALLKEKGFGSDLPNQLAEKWIKSREKLL